MESDLTLHSHELMQCYWSTSARTGCHQADAVSRVWRLWHAKSGREYSL